MKKLSALAQAADGSGPPMVQTAGCIACWRYKSRIALRACGKPNPVLIAA